VGYSATEKNHILSLLHLTRTKNKTAGGEEKCSINEHVLPVKEIVSKHRLRCPTVRASLFELYRLPTKCTKNKCYSYTSIVESKQPGRGSSGSCAGNHTGCEPSTRHTTLSLPIIIDIKAYPKDTMTHPSLTIQREKCNLFLGNTEHPLTVGFLVMHCLSLKL
jgi:hypothetical protein